MSVPGSMVSGTDGVVYQGPPPRSTLWPVGAVVSGVTVKAGAGVPAPLVAVTVWLPVAVAVLSQL